MRLVETIEELNALLEGTSVRPALIFKHSLSCGTSAMATASPQKKTQSSRSSGPLNEKVNAPKKATHSKKKWRVA